MTWIPFENPSTRRQSDGETDAESETENDKQTERETTFLPPHFSTGHCRHMNIHASLRDSFLSRVLLRSVEGDSETFITSPAEVSSHAAVRSDYHFATWATAFYSIGKKEKNEYGVCVYVSNRPQTFFSFTLVSRRDAVKYSALS